MVLDEPWVKTNMTRRYGWGPAGERSVERVPHGHRRATAVVAALRSDGLVAPRVIGGALTGAPFRAWVRQESAPRLRPGDLVVMDNLAAHKVAGVAEAIRAVAAEAVYVPPDSPGRNPIEQVFSTVRGAMRARRPRTQAACEALRGGCLDRFPPAECRNYLRHAGYVPQD